MAVLLREQTRVMPRPCSTASATIDLGSVRTAWTAKGKDAFLSRLTNYLLN